MVGAGGRQRQTTVVAATQECGGAGHACRSAATSVCGGRGGAERLSHASTRCPLPPQCLPPGLTNMPPFPLPPWSLPRIPTSPIAWPHQDATPLPKRPNHSMPLLPSPLPPPLPSPTHKDAPPPLPSPPPPPRHSRGCRQRRAPG
ncbi:unnamed protein product [Closterium sp. NIES-54]